MGIDRRLADLGALIDNYLGGHITGAAAARIAKEEHWDFQDDLSRGGSREERLFLRAFWAVVLLDEPPEYKTKDPELRYLRRCIEDPSAFSEEGADRPYHD